MKNAFVVIVVVLLSAVLFAQNARSETDFTAPYIGSQAAMRGLFPYSAEATAQIQIAYYGEVITDHRDQVRFAYPAYLIFIYAPLTIFPLKIAFVVWMTLGVLLLLIAMQRLGVSPLAGIVLILALKEPITAGLIGQTVLWSAALIGFGLDALAREQERRAGLYFALAALNPVFTIPFALLVLLRRHSALITYVLCMAILMGASLLAFGWWVPAWLNTLRSYPSYASFLIWMVQIFPPIALLAVPLVIYALMQRSDKRRAALGLSGLVLLLPLTGLYHLTLFLPIMARLQRWTWAVIGVVFWAMSPLAYEIRRWEVVIIAGVVVCACLIKDKRAESNEAALSEVELTV